MRRNVWSTRLLHFLAYAYIEESSEMFSECFNVGRISFPIANDQAEAAPREGCHASQH
jgi:hypothetical protein